MEQAIYDPVKFSALMDSLDASRHRMEVFRKQSHAALCAYVGSNYGDAIVVQQETTLNLMQLAIGIYRRQTAAREPRFLVVAESPSLAPTADDFEGALNATIMEMRFKDSLDECVLQAMFQLGVMKVGIETGGEKIADSKGTLHDAGMAFADAVSLDDFVIDMRAKRQDRIRFAADAFDLSLEAMNERGWNTKGLSPDYRTSTNEGGDRQANALQSGDAIRDDYMPMHRCWEIWLPHEKSILTVRAGGSGGFGGATALAIRKWKGPEQGPYRYLWFDKPVDCIYPVAPAIALVPLHDAYNTAINKQVDQMERKKTIGAVMQGQDDDGVSIRDASDGEIVVVKGGGLTEHKYGGADAEGLAASAHLKDLFSYAGGNLDTLGGLARSANTVGQESLITRGANAKIASMQERVLSFVSDCGQDIAWYVWTNPGKGPRFFKTIEGTDYRIPSRFDVKDGDFEQYGIQIEPYSMRSRTPEERIADTLEYLTTVAIPLEPMLRAQGNTIDLTELTELVAKYKDLPEIRRIIRKQTDGEMAGMAAATGGDQRPRQSPVTTRHNVRTSVSGTPAQGDGLKMLSEIGGSSE